jgi:hypothetical protein
VGEGKSIIHYHAQAMKKTMILAAIVSSVWFTPITWVAGAWLGVQGLCLQQECRRSYALHDEPVAPFTVLVVLPSADGLGPKKIAGVPLAHLSRESATDPAQGDAITGVPYSYILGDPSVCSVAMVPLLTASEAAAGDWGASLILPATRGATATGWDFSVTPDAAGGQRVALRSDNGMDFEYQTDGITIRPIRSRIMGGAYIYAGVLAGLIVVLVVRYAALAWLRFLSPRPLAGEGQGRGQTAVVEEITPVPRTPSP